MSAHPESPSFLSFNYILKHAGVHSVAMQAKYSDLQEKFPMPALAYVTTNIPLFLLIEKVDDAYVYVIDVRGKIRTIEKEEFIRMWSGYVMLFDEQHIKRQNISLTDKCKQLLNKVKLPFVIASFLAIIILTIGLSTSQPNFLSYIYLVLYAVGLAFSSLLLIENFDKHNPLVRKICTSKTGSKKYSCSSILGSKDAYFLGLISWSDIGFTYFLSLLILTLFFPLESFPVSVGVSLPSFSYVFYSIYYQKYVARSWCRLCLGVQATFAFLFLASLVSFQRADFSLLLNIRSMLPLLLTTAGIISLFAVVKPAIQSKFEIKILREEYTRLKHDADVLTLLLNRAKKIDPSGLRKLELGTKNAETLVTMIFSPICEPCLHELGMLLPLIRLKEKTRFEFIILIDKLAHPESERLAIDLIEAYAESSSSFEQQLDLYIHDYPKSKFRETRRSESNHTELSAEILEEHQRWCKENDISSTPTIFINHQQLPAIYSATDIDYICS